MSFTSVMCACIKVSPNHAIPKIAITARIPAWNTEPLVISSPFGLQNRMINAPTLNITISMVCAIPIGLPSNVGRKLGTAPINTTNTAPNKNNPTDIFAVGLSFISVGLVLALLSFTYSGSCKRR